MLHEETVEKGTLDLIRTLSADKNLQDFVLVGGTALSLQFGHRISLDIDLFNPKGFDPKNIGHYLQDKYKADEGLIVKGGVFTYIKDVKVDMVSVPYDWLHSIQKIDGIRMATLDDLAAMKLNAIVGNGTRIKDFVDIHELLNHRTLEQMTDAYVSRFPDMNATIAKNALLYHKDIDFSVEVNMSKGKLNWPEVVDKLQEAVQKPKKLFSVKDVASEKKSRGENLDQGNRLGRGR